MLEFNLLRLRQTERPGDVRERLLREDNRGGTHSAHRADEVHVFDSICKELQPAAILFEKAHARAINLPFDQRAHKPLVAETWSEREFPLRDIKRRLRLAQRLPVQPRRVLV